MRSTYQNLKLISILSFFAAILAIGFYFGISYQQKISAKQTQVEIKIGNNQQSYPAQINTDGLILQATFDKAAMVVRYEGGIEVPNPCYLVTHEAAWLPMQPEEVRIDIRLKPPTGDVFCAQVVTRKNFSGEVKVGRDNPTVVVLVDGKQFYPQKAK